MAVLLMMPIFFTQVAYESGNINWKHWKSSFGAIDPRYNLYQSENNILSVILSASWPQALVSLCYFGYNGVFTSFQIADVMNRFSAQRKGLRLSSPVQGSQRTTYFLTLPYRFAIPIMAINGTLHWLASQSLFLVSIQNYWSVRKDNSYTACKYSPLAILVMTLLLLSMIAVAVLFGSRKFRGEMPVAGSSSALISARCHIPADENGKEAVRQPLQWGGTGFTECEGYHGQVLHCSFSSKPVLPLKTGQICVSKTKGEELWTY
jgi:hypothetical protein